MQATNCLHDYGHVAKTVNLLNLFAERYLSLESTESSKMALEITSAWQCTSPVAC
jgi:hypothetical protein